MRPPERGRTLDGVAAGQHGVISRHQLRALGITDAAIARLVAHERLIRVAPRVFRLAGCPQTWQQEAMAALLWAGLESWLAGASAAAAWGFIDFERKGPIEIVLTRHVRPPPGIQVRYSRGLRPRDVQSLNGLRVTIPSRTLVDLAPRLSEEQLEILLDDLLHRRLVSTRLLGRMLDEVGRGRDGAGPLRKLLAVRGDGWAVPESVLETMFLRCLSEAGLPQPQRQVSVAAASMYRLDFAYPARGLFIEVDGARWHSGRAARQRDARKANEVALEGGSLLRFTWADIEGDRPYVAGSVARALGVQGSSVK